MGYRDNNKWITLHELYLLYPHKWRDLTSNTVALPYFAKDEISEHEYKMSYQEWKKALKCYYKHVMEYMIEGNVYKLPYNLGYFRLKKIRQPVASYVRWKKEIESGKRTVEDGLMTTLIPETGGYFPYLHWDRTNRSGVYFKFKSLYKVRIMPKTYFKLWNRIVKDRSILYNLVTAYDALS